MILDRFYTPGLAQVAYLVADESAGDVAVIDPRRDVDVYQEWASTRGLRITAILETHVHADFVSGAPELSAATGAPIYASALGQQDFDHVPLNDGDEIRVGQLVLRAIGTPGHTPEHMAFLLIDPASGETPVALYSGDVLFVGEVGRPDLLGKAQTQHLAGQLYETVERRLKPLADDIVVYPGHTAGSSCGKKIGDAPSTTMGQEKRYNYAFQTKGRDAFVSSILEGMPRPPAYYPVLKRVNKAGAAPLATLLAGEPLSASEVRDRATNALIIDVRTADAFADGHIPGSVFAGLGTNFTAWMGWIAPYDRDLILVLEHDDQLAEARTELRRIGLDRVAGYLKGGFDAWLSAGNDVERIAEITTARLAEQVESGLPLNLLDVRSDEEWNAGHIDGAVHLFAGAIAQGESVPFSEDAPITIVCGTGYRSMVTASLLQARGYTALTNVIGGMEAWNVRTLLAERGVPA